MLSTMMTSTLICLLLQYEHSDCDTRSGGEYELKYIRREGNLRGTCE
jgi:hypothetical protein